MNKQATYTYYYQLGQRYAFSKLAEDAKDNKKVPKSNAEVKKRLDKELKATAASIPLKLNKDKVTYSKKKNKKSTLSKILSPKITSFKPMKVNDPWMDKLDVINSAQRNNKLKLYKGSLPKPKGVSLSWKF